MKHKKGQTQIQLVIGLILVLAGASFFLKFYNIGYLLGGVGLLIETIKRIIQGGLLK
ncbi:MAG: hypothetical protein GXO79_11470 [Chlorobi bacterium]|nr:hypothetical protein [Chlorobiota bacterium]